MSECEICQGDPSLLCPECNSAQCRYCGEELLYEHEEMIGVCDRCDAGGD